jgi:NAD(P)-dependent dehydrogenase (short-subunit alcohol dehydrogenase family)
MNNLGGNNVLITGGAVRIGRAIALAFARAGATVVVHYNRSHEQARNLHRELGGISSGHRLVQTNLLDVMARDRLIPDLLATGCRLDCLVNNASVYRRAPLLEISQEQWDADFAINFLAPFRLMCSFARHCGHGNIINLLDQRVATVDPSAGAYGLAKKALRDATEAAAVQWAPAIRVNGVAPGFVLPPPGGSSQAMQKFIPEIPMQRATTPEEIAAACVFLAASPTIAGHILVVDGGLHLKPAAVAECERSRTSAAPQ